MESKELRMDRLQTMDTFLTMKILREDKKHLKKLMFGIKFKPRYDRPQKIREKIQAQIDCGDHLQDCYDYPYIKIASYTHIKELNRMMGWATAKLFKTRRMEILDAWRAGFFEGLK